MSVLENLCISWNMHASLLSYRFNKLIKAQVTQHHLLSPTKFFEAMSKFLAALSEVAHYPVPETAYESTPHTPEHVQMRLNKLWRRAIEFNVQQSENPRPVVKVSDDTECVCFFLTIRALLMNTFFVCVSSFFSTSPSTCHALFRYIFASNYVSIAQDSGESKVDVLFVQSVLAPAKAGEKLHEFLTRIKWVFLSTPTSCWCPPFLKRGICKHTMERLIRRCLWWICHTLNTERVLKRLILHSFR